MKRTVWLPSDCQLPWTCGLSTGWAPFSALATGLLKVRVIGVSGESGVPGAGEATALAPAPAGNQLTVAMWALSQVRGAAAIDAVPAYRSAAASRCPKGWPERGGAAGR